MAKRKTHNWILINKHCSCEEWHLKLLTWQSGVVGENGGVEQQKKIAFYFLIKYLHCVVKQTNKQINKGRKVQMSTCICAHVHMYMYVICLHSTIDMHAHMKSVQTKH